MDYNNIGWIRKRVQAYRQARNGNMAITMALCAVPLLLAFGVTVDYSREVTLKTQFDSIADTVAVQAVDFTSTGLTVDQAKDEAKGKFTAQAQDNAMASLDALTINITEDNTGRTASVSYTASVPPSTTGIIGVQKLSVSGSATAHTYSPSYLDVYVLADNSPSMGTGATSADTAKLISVTSSATTATGYAGACAFACHYSKSTYDTYNVARDNGVTLRIDGVRHAVNNLIDTAQAQIALKPDVTVRFALYTFGANVDQKTPAKIYSLSPDLPGAKAATAMIDVMQVTSLTSLGGSSTSFERAFNALNAAIPNSGNGQTQDLSKKLLFFISDGLQDTYNNSQPCSKPPSGGRCVSPLDQYLCDQLKSRGITVAAIYTTYVPLPTHPFYTAYIDPFNKGPYGPSPNSEIAQNMQACASKGFYQEVGPNDSIDSTLNLMFNQFLQGHSSRLSG